MRELLADLPIAVEIAFAVKAAPLPAVVATLATCCDSLELMSEWECDVAATCAVDPSRWIVNAPAAPEAFLDRLLVADSDIVVSNDSHLQYLATKTRDRLSKGTLLLRMNDGGDYLSVNHGYAAPSEVWRDTSEALRPVRRQFSAGGLHFHGKRWIAWQSVGFRQRISQAWSELAAAWGGLQVLNVGGGLPAAESTSWRPFDFRDELYGLIELLEPRPLRLVIEPGTHLVAGSAHLTISVTGGGRGGQVWVDGSARLLPEQRGMWDPSAQAPLRVTNGPLGATFRGPSCQGSDRIGDTEAVDWRGFELVSAPRPSPGDGMLTIDGVGAYHLALAAGLHGGGAVETRTLLRGVRPTQRSAAQVKRLLDTVGWAVIAHPAEKSMDVLWQYLKLFPRRSFGVRGYDAHDEIWATVPHTDGAAVADAPDLIGIRIHVPDELAGEDSVVSARSLVSGLKAAGREDLLQRAQSAVPWLGGTSFPILQDTAAGWHIRLFRPRIDWAALSANQSDHFEVLELITWLESLAICQSSRVSLDLDADQVLLLDNRSHIHWRSILRHSSERRWERWYLDVGT